MRFSERYGYKPVREIIQKESMDKDLRSKLWSILYEQLFSKDLSYDHIQDKFSPFRTKLWRDFFKNPIDELPPPKQFNHFIKNYLLGGEWFLFYDLIEFIIYNQTTPISEGYSTFFKPREFIYSINDILKSELSAYQIINYQITEITSEQEIQSIENALANTSPYSGVQQHLNQSLKLMSDRQNPDYRNSIKESISAIEGICKIIANKENAGFQETLAIIQNKYDLHKSLKEGFVKFYGYTSNGDGIRHAMLEESNLSYIDAKFMLVACTNFINYLIEKTK